jgi:hypothetical protein
LPGAGCGTACIENKQGEDEKSQWIEGTHSALLEAGGEKWYGPVLHPGTEVGNHLPGEEFMYINIPTHPLFSHRKPIVFTTR